MKDDDRDESSPPRVSRPAISDDDMMKIVSEELESALGKTSRQQRRQRERILRKAAR